MHYNSFVQPHHTHYRKNSHHLPVIVRKSVALCKNGIFGRGFGNSGEKGLSKVGVSSGAAGERVSE